MKEEWRKIPGQSAWYEVSNLGRVRSLTRSQRVRTAHGFLTSRRIKGRMLRPGLASSGYYSVSLCRRSHNVHVLVAHAFLGPCPVKHEVLHNDHVKSNCVMTNLRYGTRGENVSDDHKNGLRKYDHLNMIRRQKEFFKRIPWRGKLWTGTEFWRRFCPKFSEPQRVTDRFKRGVSPAQIIKDQHTSKRRKK